MESQSLSTPGARPKLERRSYASAPARHKHDFHQVVLPHAGTMEIDIAGRGGVVDAGQAAFVPGGALHEFASSRESDFIVLDIDTSHFTGLRDGYSVLDSYARQVFFPMTPRLHHLVGYAASFGTGPGTLPILGAWATLFIEDAIRQIGAAGGLRSTPILRACRCIETRLAEPLTVAAIARSAGVSARGLHELFRKELATTPHAYLTERRIERAQELLARSTKPIEEIAFLAGYADQSALTRALRKARGVTPAAYRKSQTRPS